MEDQDVIRIEVEGDRVEIVQPDEVKSIRIDEAREALRRELEGRFLELLGSITWTFSNETFRRKVSFALDKAFNLAFDNVIQRVRDAHPRR